MGIKEQASRAAMGKKVAKYYDPYAILAHLIAQQSPKSQRLVAAVGRGASGLSGPSTGLVRWEKGKELSRAARKRWVLRDKRKIIGQLADALAEYVRLGVMHSDLHSKNIVISGAGHRRLRRPTRVKIIDFGKAIPLTAEAMELAEQETREKGLPHPLIIYSDYDRIMRSATYYLSRTVDERERLKKYFEKRFLQKIGEKL